MLSVSFVSNRLPPEKAMRQPVINRLVPEHEGVLLTGYLPVTSLQHAGHQRSPDAALPPAERLVLLQDALQQLCGHRHAVRARVVVEEATAPGAEVSS